MHDPKAGLNTDEFATFWMLPKSFDLSFVFAVLNSLSVTALLP